MVFFKVEPSFSFQSQADTIAEQNKGGSVVDIEDDADGAPIMMEPEVVVPCNLCKVTTSKDDVIDNLFLQYENDDQDENDVATHPCQVQRRSKH